MLMTRAFELGMKAYAKGVSLDECPYDYCTLSYREWELGWLHCKGG